MDDTQQIIKFAGCEVDLLVVVEVVPPLNLPQEMLLELRLDDRRYLQQKIQLLNQIFPEGKVRSRHVVDDDVVQPTVRAARQERLDSQLIGIQVQLGTYGHALRLSRLHFLFVINFHYHQSHPNPPKNSINIDKTNEKGIICWLRVRVVMAFVKLSLITIDDATARPHPKGPLLKQILPILPLGSRSRPRGHPTGTSRSSRTTARSGSPRVAMLKPSMPANGKNPNNFVKVRQNAGISSANPKPIYTKNEFWVL